MLALSIFYNLSMYILIFNKFKDYNHALNFTFAFFCFILFIVFKNFFYLLKRYLSYRLELILGFNILYLLRIFKLVFLSQTRLLLYIYLLCF